MVPGFSPRAVIWLIARAAVSVRSEDLHAVGELLLDRTLSSDLSLSSLLMRSEMASCGFLDIATGVSSCCWRTHD